MRRIVALYLVLGCVGSAAALQPAADMRERGQWSQWRGPDGSGVSDETGLPAAWSPESARWKTALPGRGHSSPVIWGNRVFLTAELQGTVIPGAKAPKHIMNGEEFKHPDSAGADRSHTLKVICLGRDSGRILWERTAYEGQVYDDRHRKGSYAAPTPATDGRHVFAYFGTEGIYCYDFNGRLVWKASPGNMGNIGMGPGTSPVLFEDRLILQCDEENGEKSFIMALDKKTGKQIWKTDRKIQITWSTPLVARAPKRTELVTSGNEWIVSYDPKTGKELWRTKGHGANAIGTPLAGNGVAFVYAGYPTKKIFAIRLGATGDLTESSEILWQYDKGTAYVPSSILYGPYVYLVTDKGIPTCLEAATGKLIYEGGRVPVPATFTASPVAVDGKILLTSEDGDTFVIKAGPKHEVLATNSVGEPVYASPAISDGMIFIRGEKHLFCFGSKAATKAVGGL